MKQHYVLFLFLLTSVSFKLSAQLSATVASSNAVCGANNGTARVTPSGGSTYTYKWNTNATTQNISGLAAGTYTVTVYSTSGGSTTWDSIYYESFDSTVQTWTINIPTGANGATNNYWDISDSCIGNGAIGTCVDNTYSPAPGSNKCLYITNQPVAGSLSSLIPSYPGCRYDAGGPGFCSLGVCPQTNMAAQSPNINTNGTHNLVLTYQYTGGGYALTDYASLWYSINGGTNFTSLASPVRSVNSPSCMADGDEEGTWAYAYYVLPDSCVGVNDLVVRFQWTNSNSDANGADPSIAVDNVTIRDSIPGGGGSIDSIVKTITIAAITPPSVNTGSASITRTTCGQSNGAISGVTVSGGTNPITYKWTNGVGATVGTTLNISGLASGSYTLLVTDSNNCTASATVNVGSSGGPAFVTTGLSITNASCGLNNGSITGLSTSGGTPPISFKWVNSSSTTVSTTSTLTGAGAGTYTVTATDSAGCSNDTSFTLTSTPAATVPTISTARDSICSGDSATICASPQTYTSYAWGDGETTACITTPYAGNYYVTVTDNNGCSAVSNEVSIGTYTQLPVTVSQSGDTLTSYPASSYQWYRNDTAIAGATSATYVATRSGTYYVVVTDSHGCTAQSSPAMVTGINQLSNDIAFSIYPNPVNGNLLQITTGASATGQVLQVYDAQGRLIMNDKIRSERTELNVANWAAGIYLIKIAGSVQKLVKE